MVYESYMKEIERLKLAELEEIKKQDTDRCKGTIGDANKGVNKKRKKSKAHSKC